MKERPPGRTTTLLLEARTSRRGAARRSCVVTSVFMFVVSLQQPYFILNLSAVVMYELNRVVLFVWWVGDCAG